MGNLQEWRKYIDKEIEEAKKKVNKVNKEDKILDTKKESKERVVESVPIQIEKKEKAKPSYEPFLKTEEILLKKDRIRKQKQLEKIEQDIILNPAEILAQKDKKIEEEKVEEKIELQKFEKPEQAKLPLGDIEKIVSMDKGKVTKELFQKRQELIKRLLDPQLNLSEVALLLNIHKNTVRRYADNNIIPNFRTIGGRRIFKFSDVLEFLEKRGRGTEDEIKEIEDEVKEIEKN